MRNKFPIILSTITVLMLSTGCSSNNVSDQLEKPPASSSNQSVSENQKIKSYGKLVEVKGKKMNVLVTGKGEKSIVWIPGYGDVAPGLSYTKMLEELSPNYRIIVVEPFGYGLSDVTDEPRTIENITEEIHEAVRQVGADKYILMGHSISGVYAMKYIYNYRDEVAGFIGLDTSTPNMLDGMNLAIDHSEKESGEMSKEMLDLLTLPEVSDEVNEQYREIFKKVNANKSLIDESDHMNENFEKSKKYSFPADLPVAFFLASESIEGQAMSPTENKDWVKMHSDLIEKSKYAKVYEIDARHQLYLTKYKEITEKLNEFLANVPTSK